MTAIGTDSGKTVVSAILAYALKADYWKPIQAGYPTDTTTIKNWIGESIYYHPEGYLLEQPMSPHAAAKRDGVEVNLNKIKVPKTNNDLVIEGAGGLLVPVNDQDNVVDLVKRFEAEIILVSNHYLGSINHTLLSYEYLKQNGYKVLGIVFNGEENEETERIILKRTRLPFLFRVDQEKVVDQEMLEKYKPFALKALER